MAPWRAMWRLALPVLLEESLTMLVGYTDWWLTGHYLRTPDHMAAMGLLAYVMWLLTSLFASVAIGATALVARSVGSGNTAEASRVAHQALIAGGALAVVVTLVVWLTGRQFIGWMQLHGEAAELTWQFVRIVIPAIPFIMIEQVASACLRGAGDTVSGCVAKSIVNVVNMIVSPACLLGLGFAPKLGWEGLAVGTAAGHCLGGTLLLAMLLRGRAGLHIQVKRLLPDRALIHRLGRIGVPGGLDMSAVLACHLTYLAIINSLGTAAAAAHGLGLQVEALSYLPGTAFHVAAATLAGQYLGAGDRRMASQGVALTCLSGCAVMTCAAMAYLFAGESFAAFFTGDRTDPTGRHASELLTIVAVSTPSLGILSILTGGLRGAGDTRWPLLVTFTGLVGIRIPAACVLAWGDFTIPGTSLVIHGFDWGVDGAWWAMTTDVVVRSLLVTGRFLHGGWQRQFD